MTGKQRWTVSTWVGFFAVWLTVVSELDAGKYNPVLNISVPGPQWKSLPGIDGKHYSFESFKKFDVLVVVFTCNSCDYAVDYEDRLVAFARNHTGAGKRVGMVAINVNKIPADSLPEMKRRAEKKGFTFPYLFDGTQKIARDYGAGYTPEFFVLNRKRQVVYMGGMDDNPEASKVKLRYLELAVAAALDGKLPKTTETVSIGCTIRYERKRKRRARSKKKKKQNG